MSEKNTKKEESLEEGFAQIETMIAQLEQTDISLEDAFHIYEKGMKKLKECNDKIERVEKQMLMLNEQGELETL
jgi:exodeoxyribonuclease VII small subunit